jgi:hypothetical protein
MNAEFNWWLLIVGLVVGAGLVWLVIADWSRREEDLDVTERQTESAWIAETLRERGESVDAVAAAEILALHREYLRTTAPTEEPAYDPIDDLEESDEPPAADEADALTDEAAAADGATAPDYAAPHPAIAPDVEADAGSPDVAAAAASPQTDVPPSRPSVRSAPLSPRGQSTSGFESEPPAS